MAKAQFVITNAGLEAALKAQEEGLSLKLTEFTVGSAYGYEPTVNDIDLHGSVLYRGKPSKYRYISSVSKLFICNLPTTAGPFSFGEIGLWTETGVLFALCCFDNPIQKYSSVQDTVSSSVTFNCVLTLQQGSASVTLSYEDNPENLGNEIENVEKWINVASPEQMHFSPITQQLMVQELSPDGRQTLLLRNNETESWDVASTYSLVESNLEMISTGQTWLTVSSLAIDAKTLVTASNYYLLQINKNIFRLATAKAQDNVIRFSWIEPIENFRASNMLSVYIPEKHLDFITVDQLRGDIPWDRISGKPNLEVMITDAVPTGVVAMMPVKVIPTGWLYANGGTVSRTAYAKLFSVIGTTYGAGDGATTFRLPDYRGYFPRFLDDGRGVDSEPRRAVGSVQQDCIRNITGVHGGHAFKYGNPNKVSGPFVFQNVQNGGAGKERNCAVYEMMFDASRAVPTGSENRTKNMAVFPIIKYS